MKNLRADIAELFASLDGRERYEERLAAWCERRAEARREYLRDYSRTRYRTDAAWRRKVRTYVNEWRWARGVKPRTYGPIAITHGSWSGYSRGCRCDACRDASAAYQRNRRAAMARAE